MALEGLPVEVEYVLYVAGSPSYIIGTFGIGTPILWHNGMNPEPLDLSVSPSTHRILYCHY